MNSLFFSIAALLILIAFGLILPPIWRGRTVLADDKGRRNIQIARERMAELKANWLAGGISKIQYEEQAAELEQALLDDLAIESKATVSSSQGRWMAYVLALTIPLLSGLLYGILGNFQAVSHSAEMAAAVPANPGPEDIARMVDGLAERLKANPDDAEGWLMLGRSYKYLEQYPKAVDAFANAYRLLGDKPEVMLLYADALAYASNKNLSGKPSELIFKALALEPDNMNGLWLGGLAKVQQRDVDGAIKLWRKLETLLPENSDQRREMQVIIAKIGNEVSGAATQRDNAQSVVKPPVVIAVEVALAPELQTAVSPNDTVFVYAQAVTGPKMPLAIVRKQVSDLPLKVSLDDTMAMMPAMKLSNFTEVRLLARISKSGEAVTQPGDLLGEIEQVALADKNAQKIVINHAVK